MNQHLMNELVSDRIHDITHQAAQSRRPSELRAARPATGHPDRPRLRRRIGFTLIEAGVRLLASSPATHPQRQG
jgi:hypothetical protein